MALWTISRSMQLAMTPTKPARCLLLPFASLAKAATGRPSLASLPRWSAPPPSTATHVCLWPEQNSHVLGRWSG